MVQTKAAPAIKAGIFTIILAIFLVIIKAVAYALSGSLAVLSSLVDSLSDVGVSGMNTWAIRYSAKPADEEHRYGHGKIEGLAALAQAVMIGGGALYLVAEAISRIFNPQPVEAHILVIIVMMVSAVFSLAIVAIQNRALVHSGSLTVESEHAHYSTDIIIHGGVIFSVLVAYFDGPVWVDTLFAALVALSLLNTAREIGCKGLDMVLDRELPHEQRERLIKLINAHQGVLGLHDLRAIRHGMSEMISFDIEADPQLSLHDAHAITKDLEREILAIFPHAEIMIHVDPHGETADSRHKVAGVHH
jgi:ferrous-iron efflux pump FieF